MFTSDKYYSTFQAISDYDKNVLEFEGEVALETLKIGHSIYVKNNK